MPALDSSRWRTLLTKAAAAVGVVGGLTLVYASLLRKSSENLRGRIQRKYSDDAQSSDELTPRALPEPPRAGPTEAPPSRDSELAEGLRALEVICGPPKVRPDEVPLSHDSDLEDEGLRALGLISGPREAGTEEAPPSHDSELDDGLLALGLLSGPMDDSRTEQPARRQCAHGSHPAVENDEVDETVEVRRVSPEEEERRYFANLMGGDLFGDLGAEFAPDAASKRERKTVQYDQIG